MKMKIKMKMKMKSKTKMKTKKQNKTKATTKTTKTLFVQETDAFGWADSWPFEYTAWGAGQPSGENTVGHRCAAFDGDGYLFDSSCAERRPTICKYMPGGFNIEKSSGNFVRLVKILG